MEPQRAGTVAPSPPGGPTYESLGLRPLINCKGTYTIISGSLMLPAVREAMAKASTQCECGMSWHGPPPPPHHHAWGQRHTKKSLQKHSR